MAGELILIVEDNEKNLKLVRDLLQFKGFRTLEADTAERGLALAVEHQPDADPDGHSAARHGRRHRAGSLKAEPRTAAIPVIALTAFAMKEDRERFIRAGFDGYLPKPIDIKTFPDQVRAFLPARDSVHGATQPG